MKHNHHIIPRHAGGSDAPENIVRLTVEEHAAAHKKLYEQHGRWQDWVAYLGLSGQLSLTEIAKIRLQEGRKKGGQVAGRLPKDPQKQSEKTKRMWQIPGMREHLSKKRKEQSANGKNPMQGKKQSLACCCRCRKIVSCNGLTVHQKNKNCKL